MDKYLEAEKRLAVLLKVEGDLSPLTLELTGRAYCSDWSACGPLMVEHEIRTYPGVNGCMARTSYCPDTVCLYVDHPDKDTAVRFAIVQAVIAKLENQTS